MLNLRITYSSIFPEHLMENPQTSMANVPEFEGLHTLDLLVRNVLWYICVDYKTIAVQCRQSTAQAVQLRLHPYPNSQSCFPSYLPMRPIS